VEEPKGAYPTGCLDFYPADSSHLEAYLALAEQGRESEYLKTMAGGRGRQMEAPFQTTLTQEAVS